jgi:hypothetical protein
MVLTVSLQGLYDSNKSKLHTLDTLSREGGGTGPMIPGNRHGAFAGNWLMAKAACTVLIPAETKVVWKIRGSRHVFSLRVRNKPLFFGKEVFFLLAPP